MTCEAGGKAASRVIKETDRPVRDVEEWLGAGGKALDALDEALGAAGILEVGGDRSVGSYEAQHQS